MRYILEIKTRLSLIFISWCFTLFICYFYKETLLFLFIKTNSIIYNLETFYFISTNLTDLFNFYFKLAYFVSIQISFIIFIYHFFIFISPSLFNYEYKKLKLIILANFFFYIVSIMLLNNFFLPYSCFFLFNLQTSKNVNVFFEIKIIEYLNFYLTIYYIFILISQIFSVIFIDCFCVFRRLQIAG